MSVFIFLILAAISAAAEETMERCQQRREWARRAPRRVRPHTFN